MTGSSDPELWIVLVQPSKFGFIRIWRPGAVKIAAYDTHPGRKQGKPHRFRFEKQ